jgi:hypothetical protein
MSAPMLTLLQDSVHYCMISSRIDDSIAICPLINDAEREEYDKALLEWYRASSVQQLPTDAQAEPITANRNTLRWRYRLLRVSLYRPVLLAHAMCKATFTTLDHRHTIAIEKCRELTSELINDIGSTWCAEKPCQVSGCGAAWFLYQATMVPLLSLFCSFDSDAMKVCRQQVEAAMSLFSELHLWAPMADSALEEVGLIYQASQRQRSPTESATTQSITPTQLDVNGGDAHAELTDPSFYFNRCSPNALGNSFTLTQAANWDNSDCLFDLQDFTWDFEGCG